MSTNRVGTAGRGGDNATILLFGNFFSHMGGSRGPIEDVRDCLVAGNVKVEYASEFRAPVRRLLDIQRVIFTASRSDSIALIDVYSGRAFVLALLAAVALRLRCIQYVLTLHGGSLPDFAQRHACIVHFLFEHAVLITCPSRYLPRSFPQHADRITIISNPINVTQYNSVRSDTSNKRFLWLRAFHETYNPVMAVKTFAKVHVAHGDAVLTMVGPDKGDGSLQRCRETAHDLGVADAVAFIGGVPKSDVPSLMHRHDVFLNTTHVDNMPVTLIEAMASGLLVVSTDVGGVPDLVAHGVHGLLVPDDDADAMADAILDVVHDPVKAASLRHSACLHAAMFDIEPISRQWLQLLEDVIAGVE